MDSRSVSSSTKPNRRTVGRSLLAVITLVVSLIGTVDGFSPDPVAATGPTRLQAVYVVPADVAPVAGRNTATSDTVIATQGWFADQLGGSYPVFNRNGAAIEVPTVVLDETAAELFALTTNAVDATITNQIEAEVAGAPNRELLVLGSASEPVGMWLSQLAHHDPDPEPAPIVAAPYVLVGWSAVFVMGELRAGLGTAGVAVHYVTVAFFAVPHA